MKLVYIDNYTFINIEKVCGLKWASPNCTYIFTQGDNKIEVNKPLWEVKKIIENAMKEAEE